MDARYMQELYLNSALLKTLASNYYKIIMEASNKPGRDFTNKAYLFGKLAETMESDRKLTIEINQAIKNG